MQKIIYKDGNGNSHTIDGVDISYGVTIEGMGAEQEWELTCIDTVPTTVVTEFNGGRPDDR